MEEKSNATLFVIDDEESFCIVTSNLLRLHGHQVEYTVDVYEGFKYLAGHPEIDVVLLDIDLGVDLSGVEAIGEILKINPMLQIIMLTSQQTLQIGIQCMKQGAYDYLTKPLNRENLEKVLPGALERKKLQQLNTLYLEMLVHDLKNPLQNINMGIDVLCNDAARLDENIRERSKSLIKYGSWQIQTMISNILNITKFEKYSFSLNLESFVIEAEIRENIQPLADRILFSEKSFELVNRINKNFILKTDKGLLIEILNNLLSNAIRFTRPGDRIMVEIKNGEKNSIEFMVANTGSFIEEEYRDKIFDKFFKSQYYKKNQTQNFGLGLTFSRLAVQALGGDIRVECDAKLPETRFYFSVKNQK